MTIISSQFYSVKALIMRIVTSSVETFLWIYTNLKAKFISLTRCDQTNCRKRLWTVADYGRIRGTQCPLEDLAGVRLQEGPRGAHHHHEQKRRQHRGKPTNYHYHHHHLHIMIITTIFIMLSPYAIHSTSTPFWLMHPPPPTCFLAPASLFLPSTSCLLSPDS